MAGAGGPRRRPARPAVAALLAPGLVAAGAGLLVAGAALYAATPPAAPPDAVAAIRWPVPVAITPRSRYGEAVRAAGERPVEVRLPGRRPARVVPQGVTPDGALGLPRDVGEVGWWSGGAGLGRGAGAVVLAGHVDAAGQGPGAFEALRGLAPGAPVAVTGRDGRARAYTVTGRRTYPKGTLPASLFAGDGPERLVLVTCTGAYDAAARSYADNLVVTAAPTG